MKNYVLIINGEKALWQNESGYMNYTITAKLSFEESEDAEYFIEHFNGQDNYHDAMADDKEVKWSIYLQGRNGEFEDKMVKRLPINREEYYGFYDDEESDLCEDMTFMSQTAPDAEGNYTMKWKDQNGKIKITSHNLF